MHKCDLKGNQTLKLEFEKEFLKLDDELLNLKLSKPALRALVRLNIYCMDDLLGISLNELKNAHGIGPSAIIKLQDFLEK